MPWLPLFRSAVTEPPPPPPPPPPPEPPPPEPPPPVDEPPHNLIIRDKTGRLPKNPKDWPAGLKAAVAGCCGCGGGSSSSDGPYSPDCCVVEGVAPFWTITGSVKGCSEGYWQPGLGVGYTEIAPRYGGLRAAWKPGFGGPTNSYIWEEIFCIEGNNNFSIPMFYDIDTSGPCPSRQNFYTTLPHPVFGPRLRCVAKYRDRQVGAPPLTLNPITDTGIISPPFQPPRYAQGTSIYDTDVSSVYNIAADLVCNSCLGNPDYPQDPSYLLINYSLINSINILAFRPYLGATGVWLLLNGIRCRACYTAFGPPLDYDPGQRKISFLPNNVEVCPA